MSTFAFNPNIPAANNNPADDQPVMQQNYSSTSSILAVDHVGFNTAGGGRHNQVTFNSNNVPGGAPVDPVSILFTNNVNSHPQLFHRNSVNTNQYVANADGSTMLLGGIILKWGIRFGFTSGTVTFTTPFPNNCFSVIVNPYNPGPASAANDYIYANTPTTTGFFAFATKRTSLSSNTITFTYIAVGN